MDWFAPIDLYCERQGSGLWAEPLNAVSNLAFPLAALWGWIVARRIGCLTPVVMVLLVLAALIGGGSAAFHIYANHWSEYSDVVPIWSFVALYTLAAVSLVGGVPPGRVLKIGAVVATAVVVVLLATTGDDGSGAAADPLNGSGQYVPALVALLVLSIVTLRRGHPIRFWALGATLTFAVSLGFRTVDLAVCEGLPIGTHFLWHVLNGVLVALLMQGLIRTMPRQAVSG